MFRTIDPGASDASAAAKSDQAGAPAPVVQKPVTTPPADTLDGGMVTIMGLMPQLTPELRNRIQPHADRIQKQLDRKKKEESLAPGGGAPQAPPSETDSSGFRVLQTPPQEQLPQKQRERVGNNLFELGRVAQDDSLWTSVPAEVRNRFADQVGAMQNRNGDYNQALETTQNVLARDPDDRDALNQGAIAYYGQGQHREAVEYASRVVKNDGKNERAYTTRALAYYQMKNYPQAMEDAQRALALNPNNTTAFQIAKLAGTRVTTPADLHLGARQKAAAEQIAREYNAMTAQRNQLEAQTKPVAPRIPSSPMDHAADTLNKAAQAKIKIGDYQSAIQLMDRALRRNPGDVRALYTRAAAENMVGEFDRAVEDATKVLSRIPEHNKALDTRASALLQMGRVHEALVDADRSVALNPESAYAYKTRADIKKKLGDIAGMIADYKMAARLSPQFEPDLAKAAQQYGLPLESESAKSFLAAREKTPASEPPHRNKRFLLILLSSLTGGLLIAIGLVHLVTGQKAKARAKIDGAGTETSAAISSAPGLAAGYRIIRTLGNGGMGVVYEAEDKALGRKVAIKQMRDEIRLNRRERERFLQEARIVAALHHPNIVDIHSIVEDDGNLYMVFEHVEGKTVDELLEKKQRLSVREAQWIVRGVLNALSYAHMKGIIHRDLKPSNIMVTKDGTVKVMDFGIARQAKDAVAASTSTQTVAGTPLYMAPEQEQGIVRKESDLFALGACLYEMVTGVRPFQGPTTTASKLGKKYTRPSRVSSGLPPELDAVIDAALEPDPDQRIRSAADFMVKLDSIKIPSKA